MVRIKSGIQTKKKHKKVLKLAKGYWMSRHKQFKKAKEATLHAGEYAFAGRKMKKRMMRRIWIVRLNAALKEFRLKYNQFIKLLKKKGIELDRKILSHIALEYPEVFKKIIQQVKQ